MSKDIPLSKSLKLEVRANDLSNLALLGASCAVVSAFTVYAMGGLTDVASLAKRAITRYWRVSSWEKANKTRLVFITGVVNENVANDVVATLESIDAKTNIDVVLNVSGGDLNQVTRICDVLGSRGGKIRMYVPRLISGSGDLLAMMGNELFMGEYARMGRYAPGIVVGDKWVDCDYYLNLNQRNTEDLEDTNLSYRTEAKQKITTYLDKFTTLLTKRGVYNDQSAPVLLETLMTNKTYHSSRSFSYVECKNLGIQVNGYCPPEITNMC